MKSHPAPSRVGRFRRLGFSRADLSRPGLWRLGLALVAALAAVGVGGRPAVEESTVDPLTLARPALDEPLVLPIDLRLPAQKIVATMPMALRTLSDPSSARVIVTLHEPLASGPAPRTRAEHKRALLDPRRLARIANVERDFADAAARLGFRSTGALSHFAIVIGEISPERLIHLAELRQVEAIEPDLVLQANTAEGLALINSDDLNNNFGGDGDSVTVVVLDSGIDDTNPELAGKVPFHDSFNGGGGDVFKHGTQVAGIIAGDHGAAPQATLWDIKVLDNSGNSSTSVLVNALNSLMPKVDEFQIMVGAFSTPGIVFSTSCDSLDPASANVVNSFRDAGKLLIGSTGNDANATSIGVPACLDAILATGAVYDANVGSVTFGGCTDSTTAADKIACYSNGGQLVDFYAPGHQTRTAQAGGGFDNNFGGTSASAAYVAGVAAQIFSLLPGVDAADVAAALKTHGPNLTDARTGISRRRVDAVATFHALEGGSVPTPTTAAPTPTHAPPTATQTLQPGVTPTVTKTPTSPAPTPTKTATFAPGGTPAAPSSAEAKALSHTAILVEWHDGSNNETSFRIEARVASPVQTGGSGPAIQGRIGATFQEVGSTATNINYFPVEGLSPSTHYEFRVRARNASGNSGYSNVAGATTNANTPACVPDADTACLFGGKFKVEGTMKNHQGTPFTTTVMSFPGGRAESDQAVFFESFNAGNFEVGIKMVNACGFPQGNPLRNFWLFAGGLTDAETDINVQDTVTGAISTWHNPANVLPTSVGDTMAFPCNNLGGASSCVRNGTTACLLSGRFKVTGVMKNHAQPPVQFVTKVIQFAQDRAETQQAVFWQSFNVGNFEVGVKMVDACGFPQGNPLRKYWAFYGGLTDTETEIRIIRIPSGDVDVWTNPEGTLPTSVGNTVAFDCP